MTSLQNLFVAKLPRNLTDNDLQLLFEEFKPTSAKIMLDAATGKSKGFGFVLFPNEDDGKKAYERLNKTHVTVHGHSFNLCIFPSKHDGKVATEESNALYIRNIPRTRNQAEVETFLKQFGNLTYCAMREDHYGGPVWVIYAEYETVEDSKKALSQLHGNRTYFDYPVAILAKYADTEEAKRERRKRREIGAASEQQQQSLPSQQQQQPPLQDPTGGLRMPAPLPNNHYNSHQHNVAHQPHLFHNNMDAQHYQYNTNFHNTGHPANMNSNGVNQNMVQGNFNTNDQPYFRSTGGYFAQSPVYDDSTNYGMNGAPQNAANGNLLNGNVIGNFSSSTAMNGMYSQNQASPSPIGPPAFTSPPPASINSDTPSNTNGNVNGGFNSNNNLGSTNNPYSTNNENKNSPSSQTQPPSMFGFLNVTFPTVAQHSGRSSNGRNTPVTPLNISFDAGALESNSLTTPIMVSTSPKVYQIRTPEKSPSMLSGSYRHNPYAPVTPVSSCSEGPSTPKTGPIYVDVNLNGNSGAITSENSGNLSGQGKFSHSNRAINKE